jgi:hypothetical protein
MQSYRIQTCPYCGHPVEENRYVIRPDSTVCCEYDRGILRDAVSAMDFRFRLEIIQTLSC